MGPFSINHGFEQTFPAVTATSKSWYGCRCNMEITAVARAQSVHALAPNIFATVPVLDLADAVKAKYRFRTAPNAQELLNPQPSQQATFSWGKADIDGHAITIESLQILNWAGYATFVTVITRTSTDDCDSVLDHLAGWIAADFKLRTKGVHPRNYVSQLEFILNAPLQRRLDMFDRVGDLITERVRDYGFIACPEYIPTALFFHFDTSKTTNPPTLAVNFSVDRRSGVPFEENRYFSQAPLKTRDHIDALRELERVLEVGNNTRA